jgi:hypothetical protein
MWNESSSRRPIRWGLPPAFGLALLLAGCAAKQPVPQMIVEPEVGEWIVDGVAGKVIRTEHFEVFTTIRDDTFLELLPRYLEAAHYRYEGLIPPRVEKPQRLTTFLYSRRGEWERHVNQHYPRRAAVYRRIQSGAFTEGTTSVAYYTNNRTRTLSVLAHEGFHQYAAAHIAADLPAWLNEGLATYCESFELHKGETTFVPRRNPVRMRSLQEAIAAKSLLPLRDVLRTHAGEVVVATDRRVYSYYAQAWALVLFLYDQPEYAVGLQRLLDDLGSPTYRVGIGGFVAASEPVGGLPINPAEAAFRKYIADDVELFEAQFDAYLRKLAFEG